MSALDRYRVRPSGLVRVRPSGDADMVISAAEAAETDADTDIEVPASMRSYVTRREWATRPPEERRQLMEQAQSIERSEREGREAREAKINLIRNIGMALGQTGEALNAFIRSRQEASLRAIERHAQQMNTYANEQRRADQSGTDLYISQILRENPPQPPRLEPLSDNLSITPIPPAAPPPPRDNSKLIVAGVIGAAAIVGAFVYSRNKKQ